jgi:hypothetical protein
MFKSLKTAVSLIENDNLRAEIISRLNNLSDLVVRYTSEANGVLTLVDTQFDGSLDCFKSNDGVISGALNSVKTSLYHIDDAFTS